MKLSLATTALLFSTLVAAAPLSQPSAQPTVLPTPTGDRRQQSKRGSGYRAAKQALVTNSMESGRHMLMGKTDKIQYSSNWAGAIQISQNVTEVNATVIVPDATLPDNAESSSTYGGSAWIGIDGDACPGVLVKAGIDWTVQSNTTTYTAWYEFQPEGKSYDFDILVQAGDHVTLRVTSDSEAASTAYVTNESTGQTISYTYTGEMPACQAQAEWIVEDFSIDTEGGDVALVPFAAFDDVKFDQATFTQVGGDVSGPAGATMLAIQADGKSVTSCSVEGENGLDCGYVGDVISRANDIGRTG